MTDLCHAFAGGGVVVVSDGHFHLFQILGVKVGVDFGRHGNCGVVEQRTKSVAAVVRFRSTAGKHTADLP